MDKKLADRYYYNQELCSYLNIPNCEKYYKKEIFLKFKNKNKNQKYQDCVILDIEFIQIYNKLTGSTLYERANLVRKCYLYRMLEYFKLYIDFPDIDNNNIFSFNDKGFELNKSLVCEI